jgi:hypothetical protein
MRINYSSFVLSTAEPFNHLADCMTMVTCPALSPKFSFVAFFLEDTLTDYYPSVQQWGVFSIYFVGSLSICSKTCRHSVCIHCSSTTMTKSLFLSSSRRLSLIDIGDHLAICVIFLSSIGKISCSNGVID